MTWAAEVTGSLRQLARTPRAMPACVTHYFSGQLDVHVEVKGLTGPEFLWEAKQQISTWDQKTVSLRPLKQSQGMAEGFATRWPLRPEKEEPQQSRPGADACPSQSLVPLAPSSWSPFELLMCLVWSLWSFHFI